MQKITNENAKDRSTRNTIIIGIFIIIIVFVVIQNSIGNSSPSGVAKKFIQYMYSVDIYGIKELCVPEVAQYFSEDNLSSREIQKARNANYKIKSLDEEIDGDRARVYAEVYDDVSAFYSDSELIFYLIKEDGKWLIYDIR